MSALELFDMLLLVRLDRQTDRDRPCHDNIATIGPGKAQHAAELRCAKCGRHRGWLRGEALDFLKDLTQRFGAPVEPIILRDTTIGDHLMAEKPKYDNSGILFRNESKAKETDRDYRGEITISGAEYWVSGWIKTGERGKFMTLSLKPKDAPKAAAKKSLADDMSDEVPW
jgi:hypothetical protein